MSVKEMLYETIQILSEEQARIILEIAQRLQNEYSSRTGMRLARKPFYRFPKDGFKPLPRIKPLEGNGIPASQLLLEDRR